MISCGGRGPPSTRSALTLDDEQPLPSGVASDTVQLEDARGDETRESRGEDVTGVKDGNSGGDFRARVEVGDDQDGTGVLSGVSVVLLILDKECSRREPREHQGRIE